MPPRAPARDALDDLRAAVLDFARRPSPTAFRRVARLVEEADRAPARPPGRGPDRVLLAPPR